MPKNGVSMKCLTHHPIVRIVNSATIIRITRLVSCSYHSYDHPSPSLPYNTTEQVILSSAYKHIPKHGFSTEALSAGIGDLGFPGITTSGIADGAFALVRYHLTTKRNTLAEKAKFLLKESEMKSIDDKVELLTWERLLENRDIIHHWQDALAIMAQPSYVSQSLKELTALADEIYFLACDVSVDPSWYTKRGSLSVIYALSELFMTNDRSSGFSETRNFLKRRLAESSTAGSIMNAFNQYAGFTTSAAINVLRSKGVRI